MPGQQPTRTLTPTDLKANLGDIQGGLLEEYDTLACAYIFYTVGDPDRGRAWLANLLGSVTTSGAARSANKPEQTLNICFSSFGLAALGVTEQTRASFPHSFRAGMAARALKLGDTGPGDPSNWEGGLGTPDIHAMITITGADSFAVDDRRLALNKEAARYGVSERHFVEAAVVFDQRSGCPAAHFGYVDPVSQPAIAGLDDDAAPGHGARDGEGWRGIQPGEFLLGYINEINERTATPPPDELGVNGTFIAFRKAGQDVAGFRDYLKQGAMGLWGKNDTHHQEKMAAKIVGRWRSGCPLAVSPDHDDHKIADDPNRVNDFDYADDPEGLKCPLGAHLRRVNPRKSAIKTPTDINRKRILRRGLEYGPPLPEGAPDDGVPRGQAGLFVVADLELQFEFMQADWIQKGDFAGLPSEEKDPLVGTNGDGGQFTVPGADMPFLFDVRQFVTTEGGEYFFVPGMNALRGIADGKFSR
ncbi:MAG: peroxidase [Alphaproteobacteria bacterium]|nr:peroxidase [Alphaproteobacteria bacterium]